MIKLSFQEGGSVDGPGFIDKGKETHDGARLLYVEKDSRSVSAVHFVGKSVDAYIRICVKN